MYIVMTGATAGIGLVAAQQLIAAGATMVIGARVRAARTLKQTRAMQHNT